MLVDYFKNTINDLKTKVSNLFKRNQELESENKALKDELYELKRDRIIESGKENPHEAIRKTLENAGLTGYSKLQEMQKKDLNEIIENNRRKAEKEKLEQEQQRQKQRDSLTR